MRKSPCLLFTCLRKENYWPYGVDAFFNRNGLLLQYDISFETEIAKQQGGHILFLVFARGNTYLVKCWELLGNILRSFHTLRDSSSSNRVKLMII